MRGPVIVYLERVGGGAGVAHRNVQVITKSLVGPQVRVCGPLISQTVIGR